MTLLLYIWYGKFISQLKVWISTQYSWGVMMSGQVLTIYRDLIELSTWLHDQYLSYYISSDPYVAIYGVLAIDKHFLGSSSTSKLDFLQGIRPVTLIRDVSRNFSIEPVDFVLKFVFFFQIKHIQHVKSTTDWLEHCLDCAVANFRCDLEINSTLAY